MSEIRVGSIRDAAGTGAPTFTNGAIVTGVITATTFVGALTGTASTATAAATAYGLTGSPNITVGTVTGNLTGNATGLSGTPNITVGFITATEFDISGSSNALNASGLIAGVATVTTLNSSTGLVSLGSTIKTKGFIETQSTVSIAGTVLALNAANGTVFTHTTTGNIGIVSFSGISTASAGTQTYTVLVTQGATPYNTTAATGIGTVLATVVTTPSNVGYSTHIKVGGGTTIVLTSSAGALDLLTFVVSYDGNTSIASTSFKIVGFAATDFRGVVN